MDRYVYVCNGQNLIVYALMLYSVTAAPTGQLSHARMQITSRPGQPFSAGPEAKMQSKAKALHVQGQQPLVDCFRLLAMTMPPRNLPLQRVNGSRALGGLPPLEKASIEFFYFTMFQ